MLCILYIDNNDVSFQMLQSKITTGAFEIALDGEIIFSKIKSGRFPDGPELIDLFQRALTQ